MAAFGRRALAAVAWLWLSGVARAQTNPLGTVSGRVTDASGAPLGGVDVFASSPALQGVRVASSTASGDFLLPFLPPGDYALVFRLAGFREARLERAVRAAETARVDVRLDLPDAATTVTVSGDASGVVGESGAVSTSYRARLVDRLPVERDPRGATLLAPGAGATAPGGNVMIAGAVSYENLYLVDGVPVKEIVFAQPRPFAVEDAIEETGVAVAGVSAEYGRFTGGVVNVVTRSGGNDLHASLRVTLRGDAWRSLTPYERANRAEAPADDSVVPTYEATLGGPLVRDRLWYFLAGRFQETSSAKTLAYTDEPYVDTARETRLDAKATWSPTAAQSVRIGYERIDTREDNAITVGPVMDRASLLTVKTPEDLLSIHGSATATSRLFVEAQLSYRRRTPTGLGARSTDLVSGTLLRDARSSPMPMWNSPALCGVCGAAPGELREAKEADRGAALKASGFFSSPRLGAHEVAVGGEIADELRNSNSFQSGSGFIVNASSAIVESGTVRPVFLSDGSTTIEWRPIDELSSGSRFRTSSVFVNDRWRLGRVSANLGVRWDRNDSHDQSGQDVSAGSVVSPRLSAAFDPRGDGGWTVDAGFARYAASLSFNIGDLGTTAGRPARYVYAYEGPAVNAGAGNAASTADALTTLFGWFFSSGGTDRPLRAPPVVPGLNRRVGSGLVLPRSDELTLGVTRRIGGRGSVRLAGVRRVFSDQYSERVDTSTGTVVDASGRRFDLRRIENSDRVKRTYDALLLQLDVRLLSRLRVAGSYTLSWTRGNFEADNALPGLGGVAPEADLRFFPEYGEERWRAPSGPLRTDQRHRARLWALADVPLPERWGRLSLSALERVESGQAWSAVGQIDSRPYVANPGYVGQTPPQVPYYFGGRGIYRTDTVAATDLALHYAVVPTGLRHAELFTRLVVVNVFDQVAQTHPGDMTVLTAGNDRRLQRFDPFRQEPVRGVHWDLAPSFGRALSADDYAPTRSVNVSFGVRF